MTETLRTITIEEWDARRNVLKAGGLREPAYGGPLSRHVADGDTRLLKMRYDGSAAALDLWNFLLTEEDRLREARAGGQKLVGAMKDLGTVPVLAYSHPALRAFYPDGAWWIPCIMELRTGLLDIADTLGADESFCPVRAMLGAFATGNHFPLPDLLVCSVGAVCDDFSAIAQRVESLGHPVVWWEMPYRRRPDAGEPAVPLPGGGSAPARQAQWVRDELARVRQNLEDLAGTPLTDAMLEDGIRHANRFRQSLRALRHAVFTAPRSPMPALEMLVAEMLALHFCSDRDEAPRVIRALLDCVRDRVARGTGYGDDTAVRIFWVNPVADLTVMNLLEDCGARIVGTDYLFAHTLDDIPADVAPLEALARTALADPMVGSARDRADRICRDIRTFGAEAVLVSRVPGASHCAFEGRAIADVVRDRLALPTAEIEVPPISDGVRPALRQRLEALTETVRGGRKA